MLYTFKFRNIKEELYTIEIVTGGVTTPYTGNAQCGDPACVIKSDSSELYAPIKSRSCTINLVVHDYIFNLYSKNPTNSKVHVYDKNNTCTFNGYLTPCVYNQSYTYLDTVSLEAVDAVSVLKDIDFPAENRFIQLNMKDLICSLLKMAGYADNSNHTGNLYIPDTYDRLDGSSVSNVLTQLFVCGGNFFGDDEQHLPVSCYDVLTEILKYMGWSLCPDGDDVWVIDYRAEAAGSVSYKPYTIWSGTAGTAVPKNDTITISTSNEASGTPQISMDEIYNKITISDNLFEINELAPDLNEDTLHESITEMIQYNTGTSALNISQWFKQRRKSFLLWEWNSGSPQESSGYDYQTFCSFIPDSGFEHKFYHIYESNSSTHYHLENITDSGTWAGCNWYDTTNTSSNFQGTPINKYMNTVGCLLQHHALVPTNNANILPTSISWDDILTFFILNDTAPNATAMTPAQIRGFELPVLTYSVDEQLNYKPRSGTNWICIKGDIYYQGSGQYKNNDSKTFQLNLFKDPDSGQTNGEYVTCPIDKPDDVEGDLYYDNLNARRVVNDTSNIPSGYGTGWPMWKMKLRIGNNYWNGSSWTTTESTFSINYNNGPDVNSYEPEFLAMYEWMKTCSNTTYKDKVGEEGYCIPITSGESGSFIGDLELTIYTPSILPQGVNYGNNAAFSWKHIPNMVYVKDFSINYIYTNDQVWYKQHQNDYKQDYIYTAYIEGNIAKQYDLKTKLNTALVESPISRSFVLKSNGFISTMRHKTYSSISGFSGQVQELNLLDQYLDHYKNPKAIYECNIHGAVKPWHKYQYAYLNGTFMLDSYEMNLKYDNNRLKLIEF